MKPISKILSLVMALLMLCTSLPLTIFAADTPQQTQPQITVAEEKNEETVEEAAEIDPDRIYDDPVLPEGVVMEYPENVAALPTEDVQMEYPDMMAETAYANKYITEEFISYLNQCFADCRKEIDIWSFGYPYSLKSDLNHLIWREMPEWFHVHGLGYTSYNGCIDTIYVSYRDYADYYLEYEYCLEQFERGANTLLKGIEGNDQLSELEKVLLLHDRLVNWTAYDFKNYLQNTIPMQSYSAYGVFAKRVAVCDGYTKALLYLLRRVGIQSKYCLSLPMNHAWNVVYVDGEAYHVDATWDDPVWDEIGYVGHTYFMRSDESFSVGHRDWDVDAVCTSTKYDSYFWRNYDDPFVLVGNDIYCTKDKSAGIQGTRGVFYIADVENGKVTEVHSAIADDMFYEMDIDSNNELLFYSTPYAIYAWNPENGQTNLACSAENLPGFEGKFITCFKYCSGFYCYLDKQTKSHEEQLYENTLNFYHQVDTSLTYTIKFFESDGTLISSKDYYYGEFVNIPEFEEKLDENGKPLERWDKEIRMCSGNATYQRVSVDTKDYKVYYLNWNGELLLTQNYFKNEPVTFPEMVPTKESDHQYDYKFVGWETSSEKWSPENNRCTSDLYFTAQYEEQTRRYTVTFCNWDGTVLRTDVYNAYDTIIPPADPIREADEYYTYTFAGWDPGLTNVCFEDAVYYADYNRERRDYYVTFKNCNGVVITMGVYGYGEPVFQPSNPIYPYGNGEDYKFVGWDKPVTACTGDATYIACFEPVQAEEELYTVEFRDWNGDLLTSDQYRLGDTIQPPGQDPLRAANVVYYFEFIGWDQKVDTCQGNMTFTAVYEQKERTYTVRFKDWDGTVLSTQTCIWSGPVVIPQSPERAADKTYTYTFVDWDQEVMPCFGDATYTAWYAEEYIEYSVVFQDWDGSLIWKTPYHYGDAILIPDDITRPADATYTYVFSGWDQEVTTCKGSATYTATYTATYINYTVTFKNWDGTILSRKTYHYGDPVTQPATPQRPETDAYTYQFKGWDSVVTNCTGNQVYTAVFNMIKKTEEPEVVAKNGWILVSGKWYFYKNNVKQTGWLKDGAYWYYMNQEGVMQTGWIKSGTVWYYLKSSGDMATGWCKVGGVYYYFNASGAMQTGWLRDGGVWYYLQPSGAMAIGWCKVGGVYYYFNASGAMQVGWLKQGNTWYYLQPSGAMATGSLKIGSKVYRFNSSGACLNP